MSYRVVNAELVGGPECGRVMRGVYDTEAMTLLNNAVYRRRDGQGSVLESGHRAYDYVKPEAGRNA